MIHKLSRDFYVSVRKFFLYIFTISAILVILTNIAMAVPEKSDTNTAELIQSDISAGANKLNEAADSNNMENVDSNNSSSEMKDNSSGTQPGKQEIKVHLVRKGDTLYKISTRYKVSMKDLINANLRIKASKLKCGDKLLIPDMAYKTSYTMQKKVSPKYQQRRFRYKLASRGFSPLLCRLPLSTFVWPVNGILDLTSGFGIRGGKWHSGIDIPAAKGIPIFAAKTGIVEFSGYKGPYGNCVIINHGDNLSTVYGHASKLLVKTGDKVVAGQIIGHVGSTGKATGPHLHFEIRILNICRNPLAYMYVYL